MIEYIKSFLITLLITFFIAVLYICPSKQFWLTVVAIYWFGVVWYVVHWARNVS